MSARASRINSIVVLISSKRVWILRIVAEQAVSIPARSSISHLGVRLTTGAGQMPCAGPREIAIVNMKDCDDSYQAVDR